jgi:hypothetical protein
MGIEKVCTVAQKTMGDSTILRYENRVLSYRLQQKDSHTAQRAFVVSRARVVTEKNIMDARHAKNYVQVLAIEWPEQPSTNPPPENCPVLPLAPATTTSEISDSLMTSRDWENVVLEMEPSTFDNRVQRLPRLL